MHKRKHSDTDDNWSTASTIVYSDEEYISEEHNKDSESMAFFHDGEDKKLTEAVNIFFNLLKQKKRLYSRKKIQFHKLNML